MYRNDDPISYTPEEWVGRRSRRPERSLSILGVMVAQYDVVAKMFLALAPYGYVEPPLVKNVWRFGLVTRSKGEKIEWCVDLTGMDFHLIEGDPTRQLINIAKDLERAMFKQIGTKIPGGAMAR